MGRDTSRWAAVERTEFWKASLCDLLCQEAEVCNCTVHGPEGTAGYAQKEQQGMPSFCRPPSSCPQIHANLTNTSPTHHLVLCNQEQTTGFIVVPFCA